MRTATPLTLLDYMPTPKSKGTPASPGGAGNPEDYGISGNGALLLNEWAIEAMAEEGEANSDTSRRTNAITGDADGRLAASPGGAEVMNGVMDGDGDVSMPDPRSDEIIQELKNKLALSEQQTAEE